MADDEELLENAEWVLVECMAVLEKLRKRLAEGQPVKPMHLNLDEWLPWPPPDSQEGKIEVRRGFRIYHAIRDVFGAWRWEGLRTKVIDAQLWRPIQGKE